MPHFITKSCTACGACLPECPTGSIISSLRQFVIDSDTCADHATCVTVCPVNAILPMKVDPQTGARIAPGETDI